MTFSTAAIFTDHMVLQQERPIPVWGWDEPGTRVLVEFAGRRARGKAGADGRWMVKLPRHEAGGPFTLTVRGTGTVAFQDVLVGEVWVCSGQSNMEWPVSLALKPEDEIPRADHPGIRLYSVPKTTAGAPLADLPGGAWAVCTPATVPSFSAVGYFFGRELHQRLNVPVGLINASWGGTVAEAWVSREGLLAEPEVRNLVEDYERDLANLTAVQAAWQAEVDAIEARTRDAHNNGWARRWADLPAPSGEWQEMPIPGAWQTRGLNFSGILWFRKEVVLPDAWAGKPLQLTIGATDKSDTTYFNNVRVGGVTMQDRPDSWCCQRTYTVPEHIARPGRNVIAVRVHSNLYAGGMTGPAEVMQLACPGVPGAVPIPLAGPWRYAVEANYGLITMPPMPLGPGNPNSPGTLFCGMIAPLVPYALRGAIWYQGESNAARARQYRALLPALIKDWRRRWRQGPFPFLLVQLANYMDGRESPADSQWAELREAQTLTLRVPHTGMAVAIDIGDAHDIHPRNKQEVGRRLALNALAGTYGVPGVTPCGPLFRSAQREGPAFRLTFAHAEGGLVCRGPQLMGFAVAGKNRRFVWAEAHIAGETVLVYSPHVSNPVAARYGWADNPACNLHNAAGLPASPFRTDRWPAAV